MTMVGMPAEMIGQMRGAPMWPALEALAPSLAYDSAVMGDSSRGSSLPTEQLAAVATPTLVLDGGASPAWMREMARRVANALPGGSTAAWKVRRTTWPRRRLLPCWRNSSPAETARTENGAATTGRRPACARLGAGFGQRPSSRNVIGTRAGHPGT
jgi:hypothetical protein